MDGCREVKDGTIFDYFMAKKCNLQGSLCSERILVPTLGYWHAIGLKSKCLRLCSIEIRWLSCDE